MIEGHCAPGFEPVREAFAANFDSAGEVGAAFALWRGGEPLVDLWGGTRDRAGTLPWQRDTIVNVFSATKGLAALVVLRLVEAGALELDAPLARYWPGFEANGKQGLALRHVLNHRSGLSALRAQMPPESIYDHDTMAAALAAETPWWEPGTKQGYQAFTFGWLLGEVVRRVSGASIGEQLRDAIARPAGLDFRIGLAPGDFDRVADVARLAQAEAPRTDPATEKSIPEIIANNLGSVAALAFMNPPSLMGGTNTSHWRCCEIPSANGHGNARDLARIYGALGTDGLLDGLPLLEPHSLPLCWTETTKGPDEVLLVPMRFSLGFMLSEKSPRMRLGRGPRCFGHTGAGGSVGFADPDHGLGFGYVTNRLGGRAWLDPRAKRLIDASYAVLGL